MAGANKCAEDHETRPIPGALDLRSPDGAVRRNSARILLNLLVGEDGHLKRMGGFRRLGHDASKFCNQDLHDPLLGIDNPLSDCEEPCVPPSSVRIAGPAIVDVAIILTVTFAGDQAGASYSLFRNDVLVATQTTPEFTVTLPGNYKATVTTSCGEASSATFIVSDPPPIPPPSITNPAGMTVERFAPAPFLVTTTNADAVQWEFRPNPSAPWELADNYGSGSRTAGFLANTHIVLSSAQVRAKATNAGGTVFSQPANLKVIEVQPRISGNTSPPVNSPQDYTLVGIPDDWPGGNATVLWEREDVALGCLPGAAVYAIGSLYVVGVFTNDQHPDDALDPAQNAMAHDLLRQEIEYDYRAGNEGKFFHLFDEEWAGFNTAGTGNGGISLVTSSGNYVFDDQCIDGNVQPPNDPGNCSAQWIVMQQGWSLRTKFCITDTELEPPPPIPPTETDRTITQTFAAGGHYVLKATPTFHYAVNTVSSSTLTDFPLPQATFDIFILSGSINARKSFLCFTRVVSTGYIELVSTFGTDDEFSIQGWTPQGGADIDTQQPVFETNPPDGVWRRYRVDLTEEGRRKIAAGEPLTPGASWAFRYTPNSTGAEIATPVSVINCDEAAPTTEVRWLRSSKTSITLADIDGPDVRKRTSATIAGDCGFEEDSSGATWWFLCLPDNAGSSPRAGDGITLISSGFALVAASSDDSASGLGQAPYDHKVNGWSYELVSGWRVFRSRNKLGGADGLRVAL